MSSHDVRERSLAVLMVALMVGTLFPAVLAIGGEGMEPASWSGADDGHAWPMFARGADHSGVADDYERGLTDPGVKWDRTVATQGYSTVIGNFTGNVKATNSSHKWGDELHLAVYSTANQVHMVRANGADAWVLNLTGTFSAAPALGDVDGDGRTDVLLATRAGVLFAYEPVIRWNGTRFTWWANNTRREQLWNTTGEAIGTITTSSLVLDDLNGNGTDSLLVGTSQGVYCMNARYGNELWNRSVSGVSISTPAVYQVGTARNVVATSFNATPSPDRLHVYTMRGGNGALIKHLSMELTTSAGTFLPPTIPFFPSPVTADLDGSGDGDELIIVQPYESSTGRVIVFEDGDLSWGSVAYNRSLGGSGDLDHIAHATPVVADLEGDGTMDVVVASWRTYQLPLGTNTYTNVSVYKGITGTRGWATDIDETIGLDLEWAMASPVLMDADEDDVLDVLLLQYNGRLNALSGKNGTLLWDLTTRGYPASLVTTSPAVGDLDMDGFPEVVVNSQAVSFLLPDLEVDSEDITLTDPTPEEGDSVGIDVLVHNLGNADAEDVLVSVWDGDELVGNATISTIVAGSSYSARVQHSFYGRVDHILTVEVDPEGDIQELRKDNNVATKEVSIISRYGVALECPNNETFVSPGTTWHYFCEARNVGQFANRIRVTTSPAPSGWTVTVTPANFLLGPAGSPSDTTTVDVEVQVVPAAEAGPSPITVNATSQNESRNYDTLVLTTVVKGTHGIYLSPADVRGSVAPGDAVVYKFNATNIGNSVDSYSVEPVLPSPDSRWGVNVFPTQINALPPEGSREISLSVSAPYEASEGESYTVFLKVESMAEPTSYDESRTVTSVVIPDVAVLGIRYLRADGSEVDGTTTRLVVEETSTIVARVTNLRRNTDIGNLRVRFTVDGTPSDVSVQGVPAEGVTEVSYDHTFATLGVHSIQVTADPFEVISDADRSNNVAYGSVSAKSKAPVGSYEVSGTVYLSDGVTPASGASVRLTVVHSGYSFTVTADGVGAYNASLADSRYSDGDRVTVNATDGRDHAEDSLLVYSEDGGAVVDLVLSQGVHYDVELETESEDVTVDDGEEARVNVTLMAVGTRDVTVDMSVSADGWSPRLRYHNGTPVTYVDLPVGGEVELVLVFTVPTDALGDSTMTFAIDAVPREDPDVADRLNVTATVGVVLGFTITVMDAPAGDAHPGESRAHNLSVTSTGNVADTVDLSYDSNFVTWNVSFDVAVVPVPAFGQVKVMVTMDVPDYVQAGDYDIAITGVSRTNDTVVANAHIAETVEERQYGVSLLVNQPTSSGKPGETVWWQLQVRNLGNVDDTYIFTVFGLGTGWQTRFKVGAAAVTEVMLAPGESEAVVFELDIPEQFSTEPSGNMQVTVKVSSVSEATAVNNTVLGLTLKGVLDLTLDVTVNTNEPVAGKRVVFTISVTNLGPDDAEGVVVYAYFDEETEKKTVGSVPADSTKDVEIEWQPFDAGPVTVRIVVNPLEEDGTIWEVEYDNNEWVKPMKVSSAEETPLLEDPLLWLFLVVIIVVVLLAALAARGGGEEEAAEVEVVEEGDDEGYEEEEEYEDEEYEEEEEYEDDGDGGDYEDEEYEEEYEDEPREPSPAYKMEDEEEVDRSAFTVGRM
jgi:uncharacterized membrane protein